MHDVLEDLRGQLFAALEPLADTEVNRRFPGLENTIGILLRHMAGSERYWIGSVVGGEPSHRNRDAEFGHDSLSKSVLLEELRSVQAQTKQILSRTRSADLDAPVRVERARGAVEKTKAWAIIHATQHLAYHLGQVRLMATMAQKSSLGSQGGDRTSHGASRVR